MKNDRLLIIDCQILQTTAFDRGMGKYTSSLLKSIGKKTITNNSKVEIILNKNIKIDNKRETYIKSLIAGSKITYLDLPIDIGSKTEEKLKDAKLEITEYLNKLKDPSSIGYLITAPFFAGFASVFPENKSVKKYSLVYDFIPYRIWNKMRIFPDEVYFKHFNMLLEADHLFTISQFVKDDLIKIFGFNTDLVTTIDGGPFHQQNDFVVSRRPIKEKYVIYPSAPIIHKNNDNAVKGFEIFNSDNQNEYKLVITSSFDEETKKRLHNISDNVIFTGNISDSKLTQYYKNAESLLFASLSEGLGMPVLEAVTHGIPVACSNIPVLTEISANALYLFDPTSPKSIATNLQKAVDRENFQEMKKNYKLIIKKYDWDRSAEILLSTFKKTKKKNNIKKNVIVISKSPSERSPEGRLLEFIYSELYRNYHVELRLLESKTRKKLPSYVTNLTFEGTQKKADFILYLGGVKEIKNFKNTNSFRFGVKSKLITRRNKNANNLLYVTKRNLDLPLDFIDWEYSLATPGNSNANDIVNEISRVI